MPRSEARDLAGELAKCLKLVAPAGMGAEQQTVWLHAAVDALEDIRPDEVRTISAELRRSVTRPAQIVPEIARLVSAKRGRANQAHKPASPFMAEREIQLEAQARRAKARTQREVNEAHEWERNARADAQLFVTPAQRPLTAREIEALPPHIRAFGVQSGFLKHDGSAVVEVMNPEETDRIREERRR